MQDSQKVISFDHPLHILYIAKCLLLISFVCVCVGGVGDTQEARKYLEGGQM